MAEKKQQDPGEAKHEEMEKEQEAVEKEAERPPRGDDPAPEAIPSSDPVEVRGPSVERTVAPGPFGELNTLDPRNSRDPAVREAALAHVNTEVARAQVEASDTELTVKLTANEVHELLQASSGPGASADSARQKLEAALWGEVEKKLKK